MSLKQTIYEYLRGNYPDFIHKGVIGRKAVLEWGYENENAGRRCRELVKEGRIEAIYNDKGEVMYKWVAPKEAWPPSRIPKIQTANLFR